MRAPVWSLLAALACARAPAPTTPLVLLISMDTTRADDLSCYGGAHAETPNLDALAARGVRFGLALSPAPTTLSAHASLFTGRDPHGTGILRNGDALGTDLPVLAERFAAAGWDTLGVVGASAIDHNTGLNRGFRIYDDQLDAAVRKRFESSAPEVTERALAVVDQREPGAPVFLFVHYYDAHMPWASAPPAFQAKFLDPAYAGSLKPTSSAVARIIQQARREGLDAADAAQALRYHRAEVAWMDAALDELLEGLASRGLMAESLVVATSDHGESLGEPEALEVFGHGIDVDPAVLHVPLIVAGTGRFQTPVTVIDRQVRLLDVGATILGLAGRPAELGDGEDLAPLWRGTSAPSRLSFAEANKPSSHEPETGWNNLNMERGVADGGHLYVWTPWHKDTRRLYLVQPGWPSVEDPEAAAKLEAQLAAWDASAPPRRELRVDDKTVMMLKALGYWEETP